MSDAMITAFAPLIGLPCWRVARPHSSILTFEFGAPRLLVREPYIAASSSATVRQSAARRDVTPVGEWQLVIFCCHWSIKSGDVIADEESPVEQIDAVVRAIDGQRLTAFSLDASTRQAEFSFDLGATLSTWPYEMNEDEQWSLHLPDDRILTYRADGLFSLAADVDKPNQIVWHPAEQRVSIP